MYQLQYKALQDLKDCKPVVRLKHKPDTMVSTWALMAPMRHYVMVKIKDPLREVIEKAKTVAEIWDVLLASVKRIPLVTKKNTVFHNTHILIDKKALFEKYHHNEAREKLIGAAFDLDIFEYEHDGYYAFIQDWMVIELAMELAKGNWKPRFTKFPLKRNWTGPDLPSVEEIRQNMREALRE